MPKPSEFPSEWISVEPNPVPEDDPRVRMACFVADAAWLDSGEHLGAVPTSQRIRYVVRAVLGHVDEMKAREAMKE